MDADFGNYMKNAPNESSNVFGAGDPVTATIAIVFDAGDCRRESRFVVTTAPGRPTESAVAIGRELGQLFLGVFGPDAWAAAMTAMGDVADGMADVLADELPDD